MNEHRLLEQILANLHIVMLSGDGRAFDQIKMRYQKAFYQGTGDFKTFGDLQEYMHQYNPEDGTKYLEAVKKRKDEK